VSMSPFQSASPNGRLSMSLLPSSSGGFLLKEEALSPIPLITKPYEPSISPEYYDPIMGVAQAYLSGGLSTGRAAEIVRLCYDDFISQVVGRRLRLPMGPQTLAEFKSEEKGLKSYLRFR